MFNDVCCNAIPPIDVFKKLTDRYPLQVAMKGGFTWLKPKVIIFMSISTPKEWYLNIEDVDVADLERRITKITSVE